MKLASLFSFVAVSAVASLALAHGGPRVWIDGTGGKIATFAGPYPDSGNAADYHADRVFGIDMLNAYDEDGVDYQTNFPGYQRLPGGSIPSPTTFSVDIAGEPLWYTPGAGGSAGAFSTLSQQFGTTGTPRFAVTNSLSETIYSSTGLVSGNAALTYTAAGSHGHLTYTLLGNNNGTTAGGLDGIYALPLQLRAPGLTTSETYYLVLGKNSDPAQLALAEQVLEGTLVPEPASLALFGGGLLALLRRPRH